MMNRIIRQTDGSTVRPIEEFEVTVVSLAPILASDASASEAILTRLIEVCPFSIIVVGAFGKIARANSETERMFGYAQDELVGQTVDLLVPSRLRAQHARHRGQFAAHPEARLPRILSGRYRVPRRGWP
jgi:PAS domain-containing protein